MDKKIVVVAVVAAVAVVAIAAALLLTGGGSSTDDAKYKIVSGDSVSVNYTGTFYSYYGEENAAVFDTSYESVANDPNAFKANDYTPRTTYSTLNFVVDDGTLLKKFNDAVIGHSVGDIVKVNLTAEEGYAAEVETGTIPMNGNIMSNVYYTVATYFKYIYPEVELVAGTPVNYTTSYGWPGIATLIEGDSQAIPVVKMEYLPVEGESYKVYDNGKTSVYYNVKEIGDINITYDVKIVNPVHLDGNSIQMLKLEMGSRFVYITGLEGDNMLYKTGKETNNEPLYFQIEIVSVNV